MRTMLILAAIPFATTQCPQLNGSCDEEVIYDGPYFEIPADYLSDSMASCDGSELITLDSGGLLIEDGANYDEIIILDYDCDLPQHWISHGFIHADITDGQFALTTVVGVDRYGLLHVTQEDFNAYHGEEGIETWLTGTTDGDDLSFDDPDPSFLPTWDDEAYTVEVTSVHASESCIAVGLAGTYEGPDVDGTCSFTGTLRLWPVETSAQDGPVTLLPAECNDDSVATTPGA